MARLPELQYEVVVGNIGTVYSGSSERDATLTFKTYVDRSQAGRGRCANESVTLLRNGEPIQEYCPILCPECGCRVWDVPKGSKLAKCWNTEGHEDGGTLSFDTMEED